MAEFIGESDTITSMFVMDESYLKETYSRFRSNRTLAKTRLILLYGFASILLVIAALLAIGLSKYSVCFFGCGLLIFLANPLSDAWAIRSVRKSNFFNLPSKIHFSEEGMVGESDLGKSELNWRVFIKAAIFSDGVLLYQSNKMVRWIPDKSLVSAHTAARFRQLVSSKLPVKNHS